MLAPIDGLHWQQLLASSWMATDGTGLKVLVPGLPAAHDGYIELYRNRVLLGIIATCRSVGVPVQAYLTWASEHLGTHRDIFSLPLEAMTPAAFKKTLG